MKNRLNLYSAMCKVKTRAVITQCVLESLMIFFANLYIPAIIYFLQTLYMQYMSLNCV